MSNKLQMSGKQTYSDKSDLPELSVSTAFELFKQQADQTSYPNHLAQLVCPIAQLHWSKILIHEEPNSGDSAWKNEFV